MSRKVTVTEKFATVGDLKKLLEEEGLDDNAFIWLESEDGERLQVVTFIEVDAVMTPEEDHREELGLVLYHGDYEMCEEETEDVE